MHVAYGANIVTMFEWDLFKFKPFYQFRKSFKSFNFIKLKFNICFFK